MQPNGFKASELIDENATNTTTTITTTTRYPISKIFQQPNVPPVIQAPQSMISRDVFTSRIDAMQRRMNKSLSFTNETKPSLDDQMDTSSSGEVESDSLLPYLFEYDGKQYFQTSNQAINANE